MKRLNACFSSLLLVAVLLIMDLASGQYCGAKNKSPKTLPMSFALFNFKSPRLCCYIQKYCQFLELVKNRLL